MSGNWSLAQTCKYLSVSAEELNDLQKHKLVVLQTTIGGKIYSRISVEIARHLLQMGKERGWSYKTLGGYADLVFASEVGRAVLLPMGEEKPGGLGRAASWLETRYAGSVLRDLDGPEEFYDGTLVSLLRSVVTVAVGPQQYWKNRNALKASPLFPIIKYFEDKGVPILGQETSVARDAGLIFSTVLLAFANIAPPITNLFRDMAAHASGKMGINPNVSSEDQAVILKESLIAVDKLYASKATEIHSSARFEKVGRGIMRAEQRTISLELKTPAETPQEVIDNIIDLVGPYLGAFGSRVLRALYEVSNDEPYWRNPVISISSNDLLDRLGLKRDKRGYHWSENRERLRDALAAAHNLEVVGEMEGWEDGAQVRIGFRRTVLSLIGATFEAESTQGMSMADLFQSGLPKSMQIRLNFFDGIRRPDGRLGDSYVLMPRLAEPEKLVAANHSSTEERLKAYLFLCVRQTESSLVILTRQTALEHAGITNSNSYQATRTLKRALDKLGLDGTIESYTAIPIEPGDPLAIRMVGEEK